MSPLIKVTRSLNGWMDARSESHCMQLHAIIDHTNGAQRCCALQRWRWRQWQLHLMREPLFVDALKREAWNRENETRAMWPRSHKPIPNHPLTHAVQKMFSLRHSVYITASCGREKSFIFCWLRSCQLEHVIRLCCEKISTGHKQRDKGYNMYRHLIRDTIQFDGCFESRHSSQKDNKQKSRANKPNQRSANTKSKRKENDDELKCVFYYFFLIVSGSVFHWEEEGGSSKTHPSE